MPFIAKMEYDKGLAIDFSCGNRDFFLSQKGLASSFVK